MTINLIYNTIIVLTLSILSGCASYDYSDSILLNKLDKSVRNYLYSKNIVYDGMSLNKMMLDQLEGVWVRTKINDSFRSYSKAGWAVNISRNETTVYFLIFVDYKSGNTVDVVFHLQSGSVPDIARYSIEEWEGAR